MVWLVKNILHYDTGICWLCVYRSTWLCRTFVQPTVAPIVAVCKQEPVGSPHMFMFAQSNKLITWLWKNTKAEAGRWMIVGVPCVTVCLIGFVLYCILLCAAGPYLQDTFKTNNLEPWSPISPHLLLLPTSPPHHTKLFFLIIIIHLCWGAAFHNTQGHLTGA